MAVTVTATIPDFNGTATIGFMEGSLTPTAGKPPSAFHGTFTLDNLTNPQTPNLDGQADVYLTLSGGFGSADNEFPTVDADFELHWKFDSNNPTANPPAVSFSNVKLDLGQFMNSVLLPVLQSIQRETQPFKPVLDVLNAPIPGLSDISNFLGEGNVTLLELATIGADQAGYGEVANLVSNLATLVDTINGLNLHSGGAITLGGFDLSNYDLRDLSANAPPGNISNIGDANLTNLEPDDSQIATDQNVPAGDEDAESVLQKLTDPTFDFNFKLPILDDPAQGVFDLLLGRDADLVSLSAAMHVHADSSNANGLSFAGVGLMFVGSIQVDATLTFNYDTFGLRELINDLGSGQSAMTIASEIPGDIADGFYVDTAHTSRSVSGGIFAQIEASYGIVSIGVSGGGVSTGDVSTGDGEENALPDFHHAQPAGQAAGR